MQTINRDCPTEKRPIRTRFFYQHILYILKISCLKSGVASLMPQASLLANEIKLVCFLFFPKEKAAHEALEQEVE